MDFFTSHDWLNRGLESYAFKLDHLLFILISISIGVGLAFLLRKRERKTITIVLISLWGLYLTVIWLYYGIIYYQCAIGLLEFNYHTMLPLHSCCMFMFVFPFAIFPKNKIIKTAASSFLVIVNMIMAFITLFVGCPPGGYSALSFNGITSLIYHAIDVIVPLIMLITGYYDIKKNDAFLGLAVFGTLGLTIWIFDAITKSDYFYFYDGSMFPILKNISENVVPIVWTLLIVSCYVITAFVTHYGVVGLKYLLTKKKEKHEKCNEIS